MKNDKEFFAMLSGVAKNMGFGNVDFVSMAKNAPKGMNHKHLDIGYSDGSSERIHLLEKMNQENKMKKTVRMIDPPSGWKYGFPKVLPEGVTDVMAWLVENGYPQKEIDSCGEYFYCRHWDAEVDDD